MQVSPDQAPAVQPIEHQPRKGLTLVLPAWNEQETIGQAIREANAALASFATDYEIIVVDDGSTDQTAETVRAYAETNPRLRLVTHNGNRGYGAALRTGFQAAAFHLVAFTDADCQFDLQEMSYMLPLAERYDIVCGYRIDRQDTALRCFLSRGYNTFVTLLIGSPVHDLDCALKIFRREKLQGILPQCDNFFVNTEMLAKAQMQRLAIVEVGVHHRRRAGGHSKVSFRDVPRTLSSLLPFWWSRLLFPVDRFVGGSADSNLKFAICNWPSAIFLALIVLLSGLLFFPNLSYPLLEPDEGRYAEIGREMLTSGDWILPRMNQQPNYDKPPLFYWLLAGSFYLFGPSEWSARLAPAVASLLTVLATFLFGARLVGKRAAFLSATALALTAGFAQCGRFLVLDSILTLWVALGLFAGYMAVQGRRLRWSWWLASSIFCALGILTKGPVALVLVAPPLAAYVWLNRDRAAITLAHWLGYTACLLLLAAPWFIAITLRDPKFAAHFFIEHHLARFFGGEYHEQPFWYYIPVLLCGCLPWSLLLVPFGQFLFSRSAALRSLRTGSMGFCLLWCVWCVLFFSLSRGKLPPYVLPAVPAIALLIGSFLEHVLFPVAASGETIHVPLTTYLLTPLCRAAPVYTAMLIAGLGLLAGLVTWRMGLVDRGEALIQGALTCCVLFGLAMWGRRMSLKAAWGVCAILGAVTILEASQRYIPSWSYQRSPLARSEEAVRLVRDDHVPALCYGGEWGSVPFYLGSDAAIPCLNENAIINLKNFMSANRRCLIVIRHKQHVAMLHAVIPADLSAITIADVGEAKAVLVQPKEK